MERKTFVHKGVTIQPIAMKVEGGYKVREAQFIWDEGGCTKVERRLVRESRIFHTEDEAIKAAVMNACSLIDEGRIP